MKMLTWLESPNKTGLILLLALLSLTAGLCTSVADARGQEITSELNGLEQAIHWLLRATPRRQRQLEPQKELAVALITAGQTYDIDPYLLLTIAYRENSLKTLGRGELGEHGLMQVMQPRQWNCKLDDKPLSHVLCGARVYRRCLDKCKTKAGAMAYYMSGSMCTPPSASHFVRMVRSRMRLYRKLKKRFGQ